MGGLMISDKDLPTLLKHLDNQQYWLDNWGYTIYCENQENIEEYCEFKNIDNFEYIEGEDVEYEKFINDKLMEEKKNNEKIINRIKKRIQKGQKGQI